MVGIDSFLGAAGGGGLSASSSASNQGGDFKTGEAKTDNNNSSGVGNRGFINNFGAENSKQSNSQDGLQPGPSLLGSSTGSGTGSTLLWAGVLFGLIFVGWKLWKRRGN